LRAAAPGVLQRLEAPEELWKALLADLKLLLGLHQRVGIEHPLDFGRRHRSVVGRGRRTSHRPALRGRCSAAADKRPTDGDPLENTFHECANYHVMRPSAPVLPAAAAAVL